MRVLYGLSLCLSLHTLSALYILNGLYVFFIEAASCIVSHVLCLFKEHIKRTFDSPRIRSTCRPFGALLSRNYLINYAHTQEQANVPNDDDDEHDEQNTVSGGAEGKEEKDIRVG